MRSNRYPWTLCAAGALALGMLAGCSDGTSPADEARVGVGFQLARSTTTASMMSSRNDSPDGRTVVGEPPVSTPTADGLLITRDDDEILLTKAQLVVRDVRLRADAGTCADDDDASSAIVVNAGATVQADGRDERHSEDHEDDGCPVVRVGPYLVDVSLTGEDGARVTVPIPEGAYTSVRLRLHKVTSNALLDALFRQTNPDFRDISVRLEGVYNGTPFIFVGDVNVSIDIPLEAPLVIGAGGEDVTVLIDPSLWFLRPAGGLYPPALANTPGMVRAAVQHNIRVAFRAFRDHDRDGHRD